MPNTNGWSIQGVVKLEVEARLSTQLSGVEFAMKYVTVTGKHASFTLGVAERSPDDSFALSWDSSSKLPTDRDRTVPNVTLVATAMAAPGSKLWEGRDTPRALLPVHMA